MLWWASRHSDSFSVWVWVRVRVCACVCASTEDLLSQSFVRFRNEDDVLPSSGGHPSEATTPSSTGSLTASSTADTDTDSVVDICTVRHTVQSSLSNKIAFHSNANGIRRNAFFAPPLWVRHYAWSLPVTWQTCRSHHSIRHSWNPHAACKPNGCMSYRNGVVIDRSFIAEIRIFDLFLLWPWTRLHNLHIRTFPVFPGDVPAVWK